MRVGFGLASTGLSASPVLAELMIGRSEPVTVTVGVYASDAGASERITVTLASYHDPVGAAAIYNQWFATHGFIPAFELRTGSFADHGECFGEAGGTINRGAAQLKEGCIINRQQSIKRCSGRLVRCEEEGFGEGRSWRCDFG